MRGKNGKRINESTRNLAASKICMYSEVLNDTLRQVSLIINYMCKFQDKSILETKSHIGMLHYPEVTLGSQMFLQSVLGSFLHYSGS